MTSGGKCVGLKLAIQGIEIHEEYMLFDLGATDMVLGYTWLATLGETRTNWGLHIIRFQVDKEWVTITGDPTLLFAQVSLNSMEKLCDSEEVVYLLELQTLFENSKEQQQAEMPSSEVKRLLQRFQGVFKMPTGLPPKWSREHAITLQSGTFPINIRPFGYLHL